MRWIVMVMSKVMMYVNYVIMFEVFRDGNGGYRFKMGYDGWLFGKEEVEWVLEGYLGIVGDIIEGGKGVVGEFFG